MSFFSRLENRARHVNSLLCVGLDPHTADLPEPNAQAAREFCLRMIDASWEYAAAFKPNSAFFETFGASGVSALQEVIAAVPPERIRDAASARAATRLEQSESRCVSTVRLARWCRACASICRHGRGTGKSVR